MQAIGLCRFSYPALGGFQVKHETIEERVAYLYADARLEDRFRLFETIALPSLRAQTDPDFSLVIVIGDQFPPHHARRLSAMVADMPQVVVHKEPPRNQREVMKEVLNDARMYPEDPCLQFRFDDDDAVAVDFIAKLRAAARDCAPLLKQNRTVAFDWNRGFVAQCTADGIRAAEVYRQFYVASLGMLVRGNCAVTIMNFGHEKIPQFMPAVSFSDPAMFVRGLNAHNDSRQALAREPALEALSDTDKALFADRFGIDVDAVQRAFATS